MFSEMAMQNLGFRTGVRENEMPQIRQMLEDGKTPEEISETLRVEIACIKDLCDHIAKESEPKEETVGKEHDYVEQEGIKDPDDEPTRRPHKRK